MQYLIGQLADKCNVNKETIRYYERKGLIESPIRGQNGYRIYESDSVQRIGFIKRMKEVGFTLNEIDKLLGVIDQDIVKCSDIYGFIDEKLVDIQVKIKDLQKVERMLNNLKKCCKNDENLHQCSVIESLMGEDNEKE